MLIEAASFVTWVPVLSTEQSKLYTQDTSWIQG